MKLSFHSGAPLFFLLLLISSSKLSCRALTTEYGQNRKLVKVFVSELEGNEYVKEGNEYMKLLGTEDCNNGDEECMKRRMTFEAHLDYIYTQHHKP